MKRNRKLFSFLSILLSLLLVGQSCQVATAKAREGKSVLLKLQTTAINASIIDPSKNILRIEGAEGLSETVTIKPAPKTLKNGKAVKIKGKLDEDGNLNVDLSELGPANLIPSGEYTVTAKKGKKTLKAKFSFNAPKLIIGKLQVPIPDKTGEVKARILRYQTTGETPSEEASDIPDANCALYNPITQEPIEDVPTIAVPGTEALDENGNPVNAYQLVYEIPYNIAHDPENPVENPVIKASTIAETSTGEKQEVTLSAVAFPKDANTSNIINNVVVDAASDSATDIITAVLVESENQLGAGDLLLKETYENTVNAVEPAIGSAPTIDQALKSAGTAVAVGSTEIYAGIYEDLKDLNAAPEELAEIAANIAWKAPGIVELPPEDIVEKGTLDELPISTYAAGFFNFEGLGEGIPSPSEEIQAEAYTKAEVIPGSLEVESQEALKTALEAGSFPKTVFVEKALENFGKLVNLAKEGKLGTFNASSFNKIPLPPGVETNLETLGEQAQGLAFEGIDFEAAPGAILTGSFNQADFMLFAHAGVFMPPGLQDKAEIFSGKYEGTYPPGFVPPTETSDGSFTASFMPPAIAQSFSSSGGNFGIFGSMGIGEIQGNVFALNTGRAKSQSEFATTSPVQFFDPTRDGQKLTDSFQNLGSQAGAFFSQAATYISSAYAHGAPTLSSTSGSISGAPLPPFVPIGLFDIAKSSFNIGSFTAGPPSIGLSDVLGNFDSGATGGTFPGGGDATGGTSPGGFDFGIFTGGGSFGSPFSGSMGGGTFPGGGATGGTFPGGGATGGTFPGGGATGGTFPGGEHTGGTFPGGGATGGTFPGGGATGGTFPGGEHTGGTTTGGMPPTGTFTGGTTTGGMPPTGTFTGGTMPPPPGGTTTGTMPPPPGGTTTGTMPPPPTGGETMPPPPTTSTYTPPPTDTYVAPPPPPPTYVAPPPPPPPM